MTRARTVGADDDTASVRFGAFEIQPRERRLLIAGQVVAVGPRAFDVLTVLAERAGTLVSKDELLARAWPGLVVEENNLQVQVSALRKLLGPEAIATIPGHGYRLTLAPAHGESTPATRTRAPDPSPPNNLPCQLTSFVGRVRELAEVQSLLGRTRLLSLIGFGGIGKTRLALQAVSGPGNDCRDGVWFADLAPLTDARLVGQALASTLAVKEVAGRPVVDALCDHAKQRHLLLILDSCEHVVRECAGIAQRLLQACPHVRILATSRERLNIAGESVYPVPALAMPDADPAITPSALAQYEAVRLFIDRANAVEPAFVLTQQNAAAVANICRRVEGIPLAIELAAARVRVLSVEKIAERLSDRLGLLTRGDRTALPYRQTLRALIEWSHDLLAERERSLFRRLGIFPGSFTLEAAEAIGAGGDIRAEDVLDLLTELVEKSLVAVEGMGARYRLLDTVRQYADERLSQVPDDEARARAQHLAFYLAFAERARPELFRPDQAAWTASLDQERENLLAAHAACDRVEGAGESGLRLAYALKPYWFRSGLLGLGFRLTTEALAHRGAGERSLVRCRALLDAGHLCGFMNRNRDALGFLEESLAIAREIGDTDRASAALRLMGISHIQLEDWAAARPCLEECLGLARQANDPFRLSEALGAMAAFHRVQGDADAAEPLFQEALQMSRERGDLESVGINLASLAMLAAGRGAHDRARGLVGEALAIAENGGSKWVGETALAVCSGLAAIAGQWRRAAQLYGAAIAQWERMGVRQDPAEDTFLSPLIAAARDALGADGFAAADAAGRALSYEVALSEARSSLEGGR